MVLGVDAHLFDVRVPIEIVDQQVSDGSVIGADCDPAAPEVRVSDEVLDGVRFVVSDVIQADAPEPLPGAALDLAQPRCLFGTGDSDLDEHRDSLASSSEERRRHSCRSAHSLDGERSGGQAVGVADDLVAELEAASEELARLIAAVRDDQWSFPTPCAEWNVRELVAHIIESAARFATIMRAGEPPAPVSMASADRYRASARALVAALREPGVMERVYEVPIGSVPGAVVVHLRLTEALTHGWDLAKATGQEAQFDERVAEQEVEFTEGALAMVPADRKPFSPPQPVRDSATALEHLAALLGRRVDG